MSTYLRGLLTLVWLLLIAVTFASWWVASVAPRGEAGVGMPVTLVVVAIALFKARLVFRHFMEVGSGPFWLRANCDGWLAGVAATLVALYAYCLHVEGFR